MKPLKMDGCDDAIIGVVTVGDQEKLVYSHEKLIQVNISNGMTYDESVEFFCYNQERALPYMGPQAPLIAYDYSEWLANSE